MQLFITEIKMLYSKLRDTERKAAIGVIASQVSHDLMSPLYSLDVLLNISKMSGEEHELLKESISRIRGIAGSLLKKNSADGNTLDKKINLIESIQKTIKLKKLEYLQSSPEINFNFSTIQEVIYSNITHDNISRIISNLVNNSIESYEEKPAVVNIDLEVKGDIATISITDFGKGISEDLLAQIGDFGITFGKKKGSGIGLNHAMMVIKKENGNFKILSKQGLGTRIEMTIQIFSQENKV